MSRFVIRRLKLAYHILAVLLLLLIFQNCSDMGSTIRVAKIENDSSSAPISVNDHSSESDSSNTITGTDSDSDSSNIITGTDTTTVSCSKSPGTENQVRFGADVVLENVSGINFGVENVFATPCAQVEVNLYIEQAVPRDIQVKYFVFDAESPNGFTDALKASVLIRSGDSVSDKILVDVGAFESRRIRVLVTGLDSLEHEIGAFNKLDIFVGENEQSFKKYKKVAIGNSHFCGLLEDTTVECWGSNNWGQLGNGTFVDSGQPVKAIGLSGVKDLASYANHTCAILIDDRVACWGQNWRGQSGKGPDLDNYFILSGEQVDIIQQSSRILPGYIDGVEGALLISMNANHTCALTGSDRVQCWGESIHGKLGQKILDSDIYEVLLPGQIKMLSLSISSSCAVLEDQRVFCWGRDLFNSSLESANPKIVNELTGAVDLVLGSNSCVVLADGTVDCWGNNNMGQLGFDHKNRIVSPTKHPFLSNVKTLSISSDSGCAIHKNDSVSCWGYNSFGQLGDGSFKRSNLKPQVIMNAPTVDSLFVRRKNACIFASNVLSCWGNMTSQVGAMATSALSDLSEVQKFYMGTGGFNCAIHEDKTVSCAGRNISSGVNPNYSAYMGMSNSNFLTYTKVKSIKSAITMALANDFTCVVLDDKNVYCWGTPYSSRGRSPIKIENINGQAQSLVAGRNHMCVLLIDKTVKCFGDKVQSSTPIGERYYKAVEMENLSDVKFIKSGSHYTCALTESGEIHCWGKSLLNEHQSSPYSEQPVKIVSSQVFVDFDLRSSHGCAITSGEGDVYCWGVNSTGEFGNGTNDSSAIPSKVIKWSGVRKVMVENKITCALMAGGSVECLGEGRSRLIPGILAGSTEYLNPTKVDFFTGLDVKDIKITSYTICALLADHSVRCHDRFSSETAKNGVFEAVGPDASITESELMRSNQSFCVRLGGSGKVSCWGRNSDGQIGIASKSNYEIVSKSAKVLTSVDAFELLSGGPKAECTVGEFVPRVHGTHLPFVLSRFLCIEENHMRAVDTFPSNIQFKVTPTPVF